VLRSNLEFTPLPPKEMAWEVRRKSSDTSGIGKIAGHHLWCRTRFATYQTWDRRIRRKYLL